jgi:hypothetical protein
VRINVAGPALLGLISLVSGCGIDRGLTAVIVIHTNSIPVYLKSHVWGRNGFSAVLSLDRDSTRVPEPSQWNCCVDDYRWIADTPPVLVFRGDSSNLHIWETPDNAWRIPANGGLLERVKVHLVDIETLRRMTEEPGAYGVCVLRDGDLHYAEPPVEPQALSDLFSEQSSDRKTARGGC